MKRGKRRRRTKGEKEKMGKKMDKKRRKNYNNKEQEKASSSYLVLNGLMKDTCTFYSNIFAVLCHGEQSLTCEHLYKPKK
jgi:hypothetical protein